MWHWRHCTLQSWSMTRQGRFGCCSDLVPKVVGRDELLRRFNLFEEGHWDRLHAEATQVPQHLTSQRTLTPEQRAKAACQKVRVGEVSRARQCLTGAALAPGTQETLHELQDRRPQVQRRAVPEEILEHEPQPVSLDRSTQRIFPRAGRVHL